MSETPPHPPATADEATSTTPKTPPLRVSFALSPRHLSSGSLTSPERQRWSNHPKNKYVGSVNSGLDTNGLNIPVSIGPGPGPANGTIQGNRTKLDTFHSNKEDFGAELSEEAEVKEAVDTQSDYSTGEAELGEIVESVDTGQPEPPTPTSTNPPPNHTTYAGAGPHGLPRDGHGWRNHPANRPHVRLHGAAVDHNAINLQERTEAFLLEDDEKKIEEKIDTRTPNTTIFTFNKEDHTLANLLRSKLLNNSHVTFAAYRIPHPLFAKFELRVQTDGEITPKEAVLGASRDLVGDLNNLKTNFTREYELRKMVGGVQNGP